MATRGRGRDDLEGRRVRVDLPDGFNFVGTVRRDGVEGGERRLLVEDSRGGDRVVRPGRPSIEIRDLDSRPPRRAGQSTASTGSGGRRRQDVLREAYRDERRGGGSA